MKKAEPLPSVVEIWLEPVARTDRSVFGWCHAAVRSASTRAVVIVLNTEYWIVRKALETKDETTLALLLSLSLAEFLLYRRRGSKWLDMTLIKMRTVLFAEELRDVFGAQFLADALSASPPFKRITAELTSPDSIEPGVKTLIATVNLEQAEPHD